MAKDTRYRYKGKFVTAGQYSRLSNLKNVQKYLTTESVRVTRYRYKGKFVSEAKAKKLEALPRARKYVSTERVTPFVKRVKAGVEPSIEQKVLDALKADRDAAEQKRQLKAAAARAEAEKKEEHESGIAIAAEAIEYAEANDVSFDDALDAVGFDAAEYSYVTVDDIAGFAGDIFDEGELFYDFDVVDLEDDSKYKTK